MPSRPHDPIKTALADLTFSALSHALKEMPGVAVEAAHEPLQDCVVDVTQYADHEAMVIISGHGKRSFYTIKIQTDH
jgi:hypothetical protein